MRRRDVIALLASAAAWPGLSRAADRRPRIAVLALNSAAYQSDLLAAFGAELLRLGYAGGRAAEIDIRYADGDTSQLPGLARELTSENVDVVLADSPSAALAMKAAAPSLPIVCPALTDAVIPNLAASYAHPGGSVTGIGNVVEGLMAKLVELLLEVLPTARRIGFLANPTGASMVMFEREADAAARSRNASLMIIEIREAGDLEGAFRRFRSEKVDGVIIPNNALLQTMLERVATSALQAQLPAVFPLRGFVDVGGLVSYGVDHNENYRRAASYVDKILKGAAPGDLPIEFPTKVDLTVNLRTAKTLGITVPQSILLRADEVIE